MDDNTPNYTYRKSGPMQVLAPPDYERRVAVLARLEEGSLLDFYEDIEEGSAERHKQRGKFVRAVAVTLILAMVAAPLLGVGFALGTRFFDSYILPALLDDSGERANFSFENVHTPLPAGRNPNYRFSYIELVQLVKPSVVTITSTMPPGAGRGFSFNFGGSLAAGTGIIFYETTSRFYIATNAHVIEGANTVTVSIEGSRPISAVPVGRNSAEDLAVVAVYRHEAARAGVANVTLARFGSSANLLVGESVIAIGNSMGEGNTVTNGIISAIDREIFVSGRQLRVVQTNAAINQGNSGGPLVNAFGEVVGINTAKFSEQLAEGMGYAIPTDLAKPVLIEIMRSPTPPARPMIGVNIDTMTEDLAHDLTELMIYRGYNIEDFDIPTQGILITNVGQDSPAAAAGIRRLDIVTHLNGEVVIFYHEMQTLFYTKSPGDGVYLTIVRNGSEVLEKYVILGPNLNIRF